MRYGQRMDRLQKETVEKMTQRKQTVQCPVLTGSGQILEEINGNSVTETTDHTMKIVADSRQISHCEVLNGIGENLEGSIGHINTKLQSVPCDVLRDCGHILRCEVLTEYRREQWIS